MTTRASSAAGECRCLACSSLPWSREREGHRGGRSRGEVGGTSKVGGRGLVGVIKEGMRLTSGPDLGSFFTTYFR
jgi:hypothetical protein